ncbi:MAG: DinB family protein [Pirellulales bacterium]
MPFVDLALEQIRFARRYTQRLLEQTPRDDWFRQPQEGVSHIAWQVGHLAMAQYRLALERLRGDRPEDGQLISAEFLQTFGKGSAPGCDRASYPPVDEIVAVFDRVYAQTERELPGYDDLALEAAPLKPHSLFDTKRGALLWCSQHEMLHAGQIGLLRRLLGHSPLW